MKEMRYQSTSKVEVLDTGFCFGLLYYILNLGTHPTAYIKIPEGHKYYQIGYENIDIDLGVHFGLTYSNNGICIENNQNIEGWFIGWDYAHCTDYMGYEERLPVQCSSHGGKKWTTEEIYKEVREACCRLKMIKEK